MHYAVNINRTLSSILCFSYIRNGGRICNKKSYQPYLFRVLRNSILNIFKKFCQIFFLFFFPLLIDLSCRKSSKDHESPHFQGSTTLSFRVMATLKLIFMDLVFVCWEKIGFYFLNFGQTFFFKLRVLFFYKEFDKLNFV